MPRYSSLPRKHTASRPSARRRRFAWMGYFLIILFIMLVIYWLRGILLPFIIALLIGYILEPLVTRGHGVGLPRWLGVIGVYVLLTGIIALFLRFLVPIISNESGKLFAKANVVLREAPQLYERLETGVGDFIDRLSGREAAPEQAEEGMLPLRDDDWGFGPPVHKIPSVSPPALPTVSHVTFGSSDEELAEAGIPEQPSVAAVRFRGGKAELGPNKSRESVMTVEQLKPGVYGISLGSTTVEMRRQGESTYTFVAREQPMDLDESKFANVKEQIVSSMRRGLKDFSGSLLSGFINLFQGLVAGIMDALVGIIVVFLVGAFVLIDAPRIMNGIRSNVPRRYRDDWDEFLSRLDAGLSGVVRGQLIICLVNGVLSTIGFLIFIPGYAVVLGILAGVLSLVPIFGTIISSVPAIMVALTISFGHALGVLAWILGIHFVEAYLLNPNIIGRNARIHPVIVVFVLIAGEHLFGIKGILLAVPVTSAVQTVVEFAYSRIRPHVI